MECFGWREVVWCGQGSYRGVQGLDLDLAGPRLAPALVRAGTEWDALVSATPGSDVTQLSAWARLRSNVGYEALYLLGYSRS